MIRGQHNTMLADLGTLFSEGCATSLSERKLLDRFLSNGDEAAFEAILRRHGPMVLGVCRRRLSDPRDVDDAFQATFLILVERGRTLRDRDILGSWLHRVAQRVATRARSDARRRREFEGRSVVIRGQDRQIAPSGAAEAADLRAILDEELARLTEKYRTPLILCELEGRTHEQAAAEIRCPVGTVKSRLSRAREQLRSRLERRGLSAMAGLSFEAFSTEQIPSVLTEATLRAATRVVAGNGAPALAVAKLMEYASRSAMMTLPKFFATVLTAAVLVSTAAGVHARSSPGGQVPAPAVVKTAPAPLKEAARGAESNFVTVAGHCIDHFDEKPVPGAVVRLFAARGYAQPIAEIAKTNADAEGRFAFASVAAPRLEDPLDPLEYHVFAEAEGRPIGVRVVSQGSKGATEEITIHLFREQAKVSGMVFDTKGQPVAGATVSPFMINGRPIPGILTDVTGDDGRFTINGIALFANALFIRSFDVVHPDYPKATFEISDPSKTVGWRLADGCHVTGSVIDSVTGGPAAGAIVTAEASGKLERILATTNAAGRYSMVLREDDYNFSAAAKDRVSIAITDNECLVKEVREIPPLSLIEGGFIAGRVVDTITGKPIAVGNGGEPVALGLFGPSRPVGKSIWPSRQAIVDSEGRYSLRAAPGQNFPYLVNLSGDRMSWNTKDQPAVVVKAGETTAYDMLVTKESTSAEEMKAARDFIATLPAEHAKRTVRILEEFRKLSKTVDKAALWCSLMRELVAIGKDAVPLICSELDETTEDRTIRRLAFALRAIGDKSAVPALIRAIPRTLVPSSSDYGLLVTKDPVPGADELAAFMRKHSLTRGETLDRYFHFTRPVREVFASLQKLTGKNFDDAELIGIHMSEDPRRQVLQRRIFKKQAKKWADWWDEHGRELVEAKGFHAVTLTTEDEPIPPPSKDRFGPNSRIVDRLVGMRLFPPSQASDEWERCFYDLDAGAEVKWPSHIPKDEDHLDFDLLTKWAAENGVDLMCVTSKAADGTRSFVLRQFGLKAYEIERLDDRRLDKLLRSGKLPLGHEASDLLVHFNETSKKDEPGEYAAFVYVTREGNQGVIEIWDRETRMTYNVLGSVANRPGNGVDKGVGFDLKTILP